MTNKLKVQLTKKYHRRYDLHSVQNIEQKTPWKTKYATIREHVLKANSM